MSVQKSTMFLPNETFSSDITDQMLVSLIDEVQLKQGHMNHEINLVNNINGEAHN